MLKDLQKTLAELELTSECIVHLFPIPQAVATPISGSHQSDECDWINQCR